MWEEVQKCASWKLNTCYDRLHNILFICRCLKFISHLLHILTTLPWCMQSTYRLKSLLIFSHIWNTSLPDFQMMDLAAKQLKRERPTHCQQSFETGASGLLNLLGYHWLIIVSSVQFNNTSYVYWIVFTTQS